MTSFAHVANADYPAHVEDLLADHPSEPVSVAAVAGFAVIANSTSQALLFGIAAGAELDAVPIPIQALPDNRPPALSVWLSETRGDVVECVGVAVLSSDGVLRVFRRLPVSTTGVPTCQEIRVLASLNQSAGTDACIALRVVHVLRAKALFVFGSRNSAAIVSLRGARLEVRPLQQSVPSDRSSLRFGSAFYSAMRALSIGIGGKDDDWANGCGIHQLVGSVVLKDCVILTRSGGEVEKWGMRGLVWAFNVFDVVLGRDSRNRAEGAGITSDGTLVVLVRHWAQGSQARQIVCFDVRRNEPPRQIEMREPIRAIESESDSPCFMVISGDTAYLYLEESRTLAWLSVARGVSSDGQVRGSTPIEYCSKVLSFVDASYGMPDAASKGGVTACLHSAGVWVASSSVPAPISMDIAEDPRSHDSVHASLSILWRAFVQYKASQRGAAKASLRGLMHSLAGFKVQEALSQVMQRTSRKIITSVEDLDKDPMALLVDTELEKKQANHNMFLRMLGDGNLFSQIRPDAPSIAEDRIWDAITTSSKFSILTDNEKLGAAVCLRRLENSLTTVPAERHAVPRSIRNNDDEPNATPKASVSDADDGIEKHDAEFLKTVFRLLRNKRSSDSARHRNPDLTWLYRHPSEFHIFLPALYQCMAKGLSKLKIDRNTSAELEVGEGESCRRELKSIILLSCDAAATIVQGSLDAREENYELFSNGRNELTLIDNWVWDKKMCREILWKVAECTLSHSRRLPTSEKPRILRAATVVIDEYLRSSESGLASMRYASQGANITNGQKRRRLDADHETSEWGVEVRQALDILRQYGLDDDAFRLAEKYGDFGTMLSLRVQSIEFDSFMNDSLQKFGDEFAFYAFKWLEQKGEIHLLLRGMPGDSSGSDVSHREGRSERLKTLLSEYLQRDREQYTNLAWMHWFFSNDLSTGVEVLLRQIAVLSKPEKKGSASNSLSLCSIAKLALHAAERENLSIPNQEEQLSIIIARLFLNSVQEEFGSEHDSILRGEALVRRIIEESSSESENLAKRVVQALRVVEVCQTIGDSSVQKLGDYIWRRCVERQSQIWIPLAQDVSGVNDVHLREKLMSTALFRAAQDADVPSSDILNVVERGSFGGSEFVAAGCADAVTRLVRTTVALATW